MRDIKPGSYFVTFRKLADGQTEMTCSTEVGQYFSDMAKQMLIDELMFVAKRRGRDMQRYVEYRLLQMEGKSGDNIVFRHRWGLQQLLDKGTVQGVFRNPAGFGSES